MRMVAFALVLAAASPAQVALPPFSKRTLPNGVTLILSPKRDVPLLSLRAIALGGDEADPPGMTGLAEVLQDLLRRGTTTLTAEQFAEELDVLGAAWQGRVNWQAFTLGIDCLSAESAKAVELLAGAALRPAFAEAEFKKALAQRTDSVKAVKDQPERAMMNYFPKFAFGPSHPYGRVADEASLGGITRDAVVKQHQRLFGGRNLVVIAAGDFDERALGAALEKAFGAAPAGTRYEWMKDPGLPRRKGPRLLLIDKPDATQTYFFIAQDGISRTDPDRVPLQIVNTLFGGRFTSLLNDALRVSSGLTYGAQNRLPRDRMRSVNYIATFTKSETTVEAIDLALKVLDGFVKNGIDAAGLESAKNYIKGMYPTQTLETHGQIATVLGDLAVFDLNRGEVDDLFSSIDAVTVERANAAIRKHYRGDRLQLVLLGPAAKIREQVKKYASEMRVVSINDTGFPVPEF